MYASDRLRKDKEMAILSCKKSADALIWLYDFRDDKDVCMAAADMPTGVHVTLRYISQRLQDDEEVVLAFCHWKPVNYYHASDRIKNDREFAIKFVKKNGTNIKMLPPKFKNDYDIALTACKNTVPYSNGWDCVPEYFREDEEFKNEVKKALGRSYGSIMDYCRKRMKRESEKINK